MLHYYAKDFFAPVIVTPRLTSSDDLTIYIVSDQLYWLTNCHLDIRVYNWKSMTPIYTKSYHNIIIVSTSTMESISIHVIYAYVYLTYTDYTLMFSATQQSHKNHNFLVRHVSLSSGLRFVGIRQEILRSYFVVHR